MKPTIRPYRQQDWPELWNVIRPIFRAGETYPVAPDISEDEAHSYWITSPRETFVAIDRDNILVGSYTIKANQPTLGAHVANCGYIVREDMQGRGIGSALCDHSIEAARTLGFRALQFNLVVETNSASINLWKKKGFSIVGRLPGAFNHRACGYVDALVFYKELSIK